MIVDNRVDIVFLTETWPHEQGDEAHIVAMTPPGYEFRSFPRTGMQRGRGVGVVFRARLSSCISCKRLPHTSFEVAELKLSVKQVSTTCICIYRPPPSKRNKLTNSAFLQEFPELLTGFVNSCDVSILGDFNFHFDDLSDPQVARLRHFWRTITSRNWLMFPRADTVTYSTGSSSVMRAVACLSQAS